MNPANHLSGCINNASVYGINVSKHTQTHTYVLIFPPQMTAPHPHEADQPTLTRVLQQLNGPPPPASCLDSPYPTELCVPRQFAAGPQRCVQSQLLVIWCWSKCSEHRGTPPSIIPTGTSAPSAERHHPTLCQLQGEKVAPAHLDKCCKSAAARKTQGVRAKGGGGSSDSSMRRHEAAAQ